MVNDDGTSRSVYFNGFDFTGATAKLPFEHEVLTKEQVQNWQTYPKGSLFVVDEADRLFNAYGSRQHSHWTTELNRLRHDGYSFIFITQDINFIPLQCMPLVANLSIYAPSQKILLTIGYLINHHESCHTKKSDFSTTTKSISTFIKVQKSTTKRYRYPKHSKQ